MRADPDPLGRHHVKIFQVRNTWVLELDNNYKHVEESAVSGNAVATGETKHVEGCGPIQNLWIGTMCGFSNAKLDSNK